MFIACIPLAPGFADESSILSILANCDATALPPRLRTSLRKAGRCRPELKGVELVKSRLGARVTKAWTKRQERAQVIGDWRRCAAPRTGAHADCVRMSQRCGNQRRADRGRGCLHARGGRPIQSLGTQADRGLHGPLDRSVAGVNSSAYAVTNAGAATADRPTSDHLQRLTGATQADAPTSVCVRGQPVREHVSLKGGCLQSATHWKRERITERRCPWALCGTRPQWFRLPNAASTTALRVRTGRLIALTKAARPIFAELRGKPMLSQVRLWYCQNSFSRPSSRLDAR